MSNHGNNYAANLNAFTQASGNLTNVIQTNKVNRKNRRYAEKVYNKTFWDNRKNQDRANWYNSPKQQMKRFKEAGLNPNLIYGQGNSGPSGVQPGTTQQSTEFKPITDQAEAGANMFEGYANTTQMRLQAAQIQAQTHLIEKQTLNTMSQTDLSLYSLEDQQAMEESRRRLLGSRADNIEQSTSSSKTQQQLSIIKNTRDTTLAISKLLTDSVGRRQAKSIISHTNVKREIDEFKRDMWAQKINPNDPLWARQLLGLFEKIMKIEGSNLPNPKFLNPLKNFRTNDKKNQTGRTHSKYGRR